MSGTNFKETVKQVAPDLGPHFPQSRTAWEVLESTFDQPETEDEVYQIPKAEVTELSMDQVMKRLLDLETRLEKSSIELFRDYLSDDGTDDDLEEWFDAFFLFLGLKEVKHFIS